MKKILIVLLCAGTVLTVACRNKKEEERKRLEIERIRQDQEAAKLADEQRIMELQLRAQQDSIASTVVAQPRAKARPSSFYVVIGSFRVAGNAQNYVSMQRSAFPDATIVKARGWNHVTVGGRFGSFGAAANTLGFVTSTLIEGGSAGAVSEEEEAVEDDEEEEVDEEDEDANNLDEAEEEEEEEEEYVEEAAPAPARAQQSGAVGQAWIMAL
ncbi:hypothetical protein FACS1894156_2060 [Bacteroidia bacterium]|nr:hypothetical protein FACS1894156_2060 [Bacteroidia bacterium]